MHLYIIAIKSQVPRYLEQRRNTLRKSVYRYRRHGSKAKKDEMVYEDVGVEKIHKTKV